MTVAVPVLDAIIGGACTLLVGILIGHWARSRWPR